MPPPGRLPFSIPYVITPFLLSQNSEFPFLRNTLLEGLELTFSNNVPPRFKQTFPIRWTVCSKSHPKSEIFTSHVERSGEGRSRLLDPTADLLQRRKHLVMSYSSDGILWLFDLSLFLSFFLSFFLSLSLWCRVACCCLVAFSQERS